MIGATQYKHEDANALSSVPTTRGLCDNIERSGFVRRGLAAIARSELANDWIPAEDVVRRLEAKVAAARAT